MALDLMAAFTEPPPPIDYVLPNMVAGTVGALVSPGGAGKSMLILQLAAQIAGGPDLLEVGELPTGSVVYLPAEDPPVAIHHRLHALGTHLTAAQRQRAGQWIAVLIGFVLASVADGSRRPGSWERGMLEQMGLIADCDEHYTYRAQYGNEVEK